MSRANWKERCRAGVREGIVPFFIQYGILVLVILEFAFLIANEAYPKLAGVPLTGANDPNIVRFVYMLATLPITCLLLRLAARSRGKNAPFWLALVAGIILWQGLGECSWHFGERLAGEFVFFPKIEGVQGTALIICYLPAMVLVCRSEKQPFWLRTFMLSFGANWLGHIILIGTAPAGMALTGIASEAQWHKIVACCVSVPGFFFVLWKILFSSRSRENRLLLSILLYAAAGNIAEGIWGLGSMLE